MPCMQGASPVPWRPSWRASTAPKGSLEGTFLKVRREGIVGEEVVHLALGISEEGLKEVLTFFPASFRESAKVWKEVLSDLKERG